MPSRSSAVLAVAAILLAAAASAAVSVAESNDLGYDSGLQWGLDVIGAEAAWAESTGAGIVIAVVDSGVQRSHADLRDQLVDGIACIGTTGDPGRCAGPPDDDNGHGTHVAGIAAARTGNGIGVAGTAPDARIMPVRVLRQQCTGEVCRVAGNEADVSAGIRWAVEHGADIINLSLGSSTDSVLGEDFAAAVRDAWDNGVIAVVAAGNDYVLQPEFGELPAVVVASTTRSDRAPGYSNGVGEAQWAISVPGGDEGDEADDCAIGGDPNGILSTYYSPDDDEVYACLAGTSMAAPHVSGALALLRAQGLDPSTSVRRILDTAVDLGAPGPDAMFGAGRLDLAAAVGATVGAEPAPTTTTASSTTTSAADRVVPASTPSSTVPAPAPTVSEPAATDDAPAGFSDVPDTPAPVVFEDAAGPLAQPETNGAPTVAPWLLTLAATAILATATATGHAYRRLGV